MHVETFVSNQERGDLELGLGETEGFRRSLAVTQPPLVLNHCEVAAATATETASQIAIDAHASADMRNAKCSKGGNSEWKQYTENNTRNE